MTTKTRQGTLMNLIAATMVAMAAYAFSIAEAGLVATAEGPAAPPPSMARTA